MSKGKILYVATSDIHLHAFHRPYISWLISEGYVVDLAFERRGGYEFEGVHEIFELSFPRSFNFNLRKGYKALKSIIDHGDYKMVHCHTPIPSMLARLAAKKARRRGTKVLYTAHGFHFYKGAPFKNWLLYYTAEYWLSKYTDGIVTINQEDFDYINEKMFHKDSYYIKGIGVNSSKFRVFSNLEKTVTREKLGYSEDNFLLLYVAEFIPRKNHEFIIRNLPELVAEVPQIKVLFAGTGILLEPMKNLAKELNVEEHIDFLGFRSDVNILSAVSDVGVSSSKHEGLGLGLAEEMMCGIPLLASVDRGHKEMIEHGINGYFFRQSNDKEFKDYTRKLFEDPALRMQMGIAAKEKSKEFDIENSLNSMIKIYQNYL